MPLPTFSGFGLGLRKPHYAEFLETAVPVDFVEVISENFMVAGGRPRHILRQVRERHPVALHGVSLSVGSAHGLDPDYLTRLRALADEIEPLFVSDHLSWSRAPGFNSHDLLPLPYNAEALETVCANLARAQDALGRQLLMENPSSYMTYPQSDMSEWEFLRTVADRTGCGLLLDVNNIHVSAINHGLDPIAYVAGLPLDRVRQIHLAGHSQGETLLIDTHDQPVAPAVWALFAHVMALVGPVAVMIERDDNIPPLAELLAELDQARAFASRRMAA
ncbi:MNIO family bufferin maturase [Novosphingobium rhizosphaerae]|uniref:MNIO family bufferin maturase n=1 Tax=Novosphingobium rhizosphaerae TaxID=1551649 RepID=UPI003D818E49